MPKAWGIEAEAMQERADLFFIYLSFYFNEFHDEDNMQTAAAMALQVSE